VKKRAAKSVDDGNTKKRATKAADDADLDNMVPR
jgi:hypothetical protein